MRESAAADPVKAELHSLPCVSRKWGKWLSQSAAVWDGRQKGRHWTGPSTAASPGHLRWLVCVTFLWYKWHEQKIHQTSNVHPYCLSQSAVFYRLWDRNGSSRGSGSNWPADFEWCCGESLDCAPVNTRLSLQCRHICKDCNGFCYSTNWTLFCNPDVKCSVLHALLGSFLKF